MIKTVVIHVVAVVGLILLSVWAFGGSGGDDQGAGVGTELLEDRQAKMTGEAAAMGRGAVAFLWGGVYLAYLFIKFLLPKITEAMSGMMIGESVAPPKIEEANTMRTARVALARGDYEAAVKAFETAAEEMPDDRMPIVECVKVQVENLEDLEGAVETYKAALKREWGEADEAFFMFRLAELYEEKLEDLESARDVLEDIAGAFPETAHFTNALNKLVTA